MFRILLLFLVLAGCQSIQEKNIGVLRDRAEKLKPLNTWHPTWCRVEAKLTQPALARYQEMLKVEDLGSDSLTYTWKARKSLCEILPLQQTDLAKNHKAFLETAMCTLLQVYFVNSPFADLPFKPEDVVSEGDRVHIRASQTNPDLGVYVDTKQVGIETRTKTRGTLTAVYAETDRQFLPKRIEQRVGATQIVLDEFEFGPTPVGGRRLPKSFWISAGEDKAIQHTQIFLSDCQNF